MKLHLNMQNNSKPIYAELESKRFGKNVYRLNTDRLLFNDIVQDIEKYEIDLLILRVPSTEVYQLHLLNQLSCEYIIADTLVYYSIDLNKIETPILKNNNLQFQLASESDKDLLYPLVMETFDGYKNHYYSNPHLNKNGILEGYAEWTLGHIESPNKLCFIAKDGDKIVAFASCSYIDDTAEGVIFGVSKDYAGRGIYTDLIKYSHIYFKEKGFKMMKVSTQIQNYTVQRVWIKEGYLIENAYITIHINNFIKKQNDTI